ncbi:hypothetical protein ACF08E_21240 [Streptomyces globisporus]|uniref:hypothetical protein n=1 Tax=Streptomyces globisporus TaxID=1908 RepID=UPI0036FB6B17
MRTGTGLTEKNLRQLLNEWDPIGVADEYDCMLAPLLGRLRRGADQAEIAAFLRTELVEHFGLTPAPAEPEAVATRLMALKAEDA